MSEKFERQPWNPFPLAALSAGEKYDLSACAMAVLIYLAARSNYTGWTCVGHKRIRTDLRRSKDFVTRGLQELYEKGVVVNKQRNHWGEQADSRIISQELLPAEWRTPNPEEQDLISNPDSVSSPDSKDLNEKSSPDFGSPVLTGSVKPYSSEPTGNQTQTSQEGLSELVSGSLATLATTVSDASHPDRTPTGNEQAFSRDQVEMVGMAISSCFGYGVKPSQTVIKRILTAHPDFVWNYEAVDQLKKLLTQYTKTGKSWKKTILSQDDLAFRWESPNEKTSLYGQMMRALGRGPQEEIPVENPVEGSARKFEMVVEEVGDEPAEGFATNGSFDSLVDLSEPEPEPKPTETLAQTQARCREFEVYNGAEVLAVVTAYKASNPLLRRFRDADLWAYHNGKKWKLGADKDIIQAACDKENEVVA
jgi:hypothetical protein